MTHVLDEPIEAAEEAIHESFITRHGYDHWEPGLPKAQKQEARGSLRSMVAVLRILRAERECSRGELTYRAVMASAERERDRLKDKADELRAEGRREERERVDAFVTAKIQQVQEELREGVSDMRNAMGHVQAMSNLRLAIKHGDHWKDGGE